MVNGFSNPYFIELDNNDNIYVTEQTGNRIQVFTASGEYSYSIGTGFLGYGPGEFNSPAGIDIDSNGNIFVAEYNNKRIQVFTASGEYSYSFSTGSSRPNGLALDSKGNIYVSDTVNHCIQVYTASGDCSYTFGGYGSEPGQFIVPFGVGIDSSDLIYVADSGNHRVQVLSASGSFVYSIAESGPSGVKVHNDKIYMATTYNRIVVHYKPPTTHTVESGNIGIGTSSPTEKLEVDGNVKITNNLILANGSNSVSQTILRAMTQSEARTITLPDASGIVLVTDDGSITVPDGTITASKLANNPGNGITGQVLISNGDGSFGWENADGVFTTEGSTHTVETGNVGIG
ncbi:MAG: SMP-30/gluconolaconase/LRE domain protein, partial [Candidatus Magnetoglobus multicellularis str. Araruama]